MQSAYQARNGSDTFEIEASTRSSVGRVWLSESQGRESESRRVY